MLDFPTVAALTADRCPATGATLVLDIETLPEGQDIGALMGHVERRWGSRPMLACIAHSSAIELRLQGLMGGCGRLLGRLRGRGRADRSAARAQ